MSDTASKEELLAIAQALYPERYAKKYGTRPGEQALVTMHVFIDDEFIETVQYFDSFIPKSWLFLCPQCGRTWAKGLAEHPKTSFMFYSIHCSEHGGGSFLMRGDYPGTGTGFLKSKEFMLYELNLYLRNPGFYHNRDGTFHRKEDELK